MKMFPTHRLVNFCATDLDLIGISTALIHSNRAHQNERDT